MASFGFWRRRDFPELLSVVSFCLMLLLSVPLSPLHVTTSARRNWAPSIPGLKSPSLHHPIYRHASCFPHDWMTVSLNFFHCKTRTLLPPGPKSLMFLTAFCAFVGSIFQVQGSTDYLFEATETFFIMFLKILPGSIHCSVPKPLLHF